MATALNSVSTASSGLMARPRRGTPGGQRWHPLVAPGGSWVGARVAGCPFSPWPCASGPVAALWGKARSKLNIREVSGSKRFDAIACDFPRKRSSVFIRPVEPNHAPETLARAAAFRRNRRHNPPVAPSGRLSLLPPVIMPTGSISCLGPPFRALPATLFLWR